MEVKSKKVRNPPKSSEHMWQAKYVSLYGIKIKIIIKKKTDKQSCLY